MESKSKEVTIHNGSIVETMAATFNMEPKKFLATIKATVIKPGQGQKPASDEELAAFLMVASEYKLNPFLKEIYAFPSRRGGIEPMVPIDGWISMVNRHPAFDGMDTEDILDDKGKLKAIKTVMYRKDRSRPTSHIEYLDECFDSKKEPWRKWPHRMLGHKSYIQCARKAFGFGGIYDQDEIERMNSVKDITPDNTTTVVESPIGMGDLETPEIDTEAKVIVTEKEKEGAVDAEVVEGEDDLDVTVQSFIDRIEKIGNKFEGENWLTKYSSEINKLPEDAREVIMANYNGKLEELSDQSDNKDEEKGENEDVLVTQYITAFGKAKTIEELDDIFDAAQAKISSGKKVVALRRARDTKAGEIKDKK